ncbi:hypothetical protein DASC09_022680 [Saccharomycopsis crataegensis]|uniref:Uncharacterized protein n=1 Tax=Saccharomycopsis crataegensis TaxID=43959 RepID=A0AAV5QJI3_9ASCO|nr:hypothetical protein DASC09_022680 [Saccharomycopsis crataegensis]
MTIILSNDSPSVIDLEAQAAPSEKQHLCRTTKEHHTDKRRWHQSLIYYFIIVFSTLVIVIILNVCSVVLKVPQAANDSSSKIGELLESSSSVINPSSQYIDNNDFIAVSSPSQINTEESPSFVKKSLPTKPHAIRLGNSVYNDFNDY